MSNEEDNLIARQKNRDLLQEINSYIQEGQILRKVLINGRDAHQLPDPTQIFSSKRQIKKGRLFGWSNKQLGWL